MTEYWWTAGIIIGVAVAGVLVFFFYSPWRSRRRDAELARAREAFRVRREWLEARFVDLTSASGKPRGLRWVDCQFDNDITYALDRETRELSALVAITIRFEAIEGGPMEEVEAVGNLRYASAVFRYTGHQWTTDGRAIFNLNPTEAIEHFRSSLIIIGQEPAGQA